jgi:asparagine synthase (glutamine-hydrolysing)
MCGIAGILRQDGAPIDGALLRRMTDVLAHRGPDGEGFHVAGPIGLGHRRLAIIDVVGGAQPMLSADGAVAITYNGEVYNFRELRAELQARGFRFRTTSDTEVVLHAYEAWGEAALRRLRGMFAFAISDLRRRQLFLARDRVGIKPLVYAWDGRCLRFGSEIKALLQDGALSRELDWAAVDEYFRHGYITSPRTIFSSIRKLPPASYLVCSLDRGEPRIARYWDLKFTPGPAKAEADWIDHLGTLLDESVRLHMVADVPVGAFLSGGLDSSTVVAHMARFSGQSARTFSIGFDEPEFDELDYARQVAARYATNHVELVVKPDVVEILPRLAWQFDEPFADASAVPTYCVSKITREHVTVALSGDGGDESFAGYNRYADALSLERQAHRLRAVRPLVRLLAAAAPAGLRGSGHLALLGMAPLERYFRMMTYQSDVSLGELFTPEARSRLAPPTGHARFVRLAAESGSEDYLSRLQYIDIHHYLPDDILTKIDRTSMLVSLETRVPLLDHILMEHVAAMPPALKFRGGAGKYVLKQAMRDLLPPAILTRSKMGFGVPLGRWFRNELKTFVADVLLSSRGRSRGIIRPEAVSRLLQRHAGGRHDLSVAIWSLMCFELWCAEWLDR